MPPKLKKSKDAQQKSAAQRGKQAKKKWTKGKVKDKSQHACYIDKTLYQRMLTDIPKMKVITVAILIDKFKINGSIARKVMRHFAEKKIIKQIGEHHHSFYLFTTTAEKKAKEEEKVVEKTKKEKKGKKNQN